MRKVLLESTPITLVIVNTIVGAAEMRKVIHSPRQVNPTNTGVPSMMSRFEVVCLPAPHSPSAAVGTPSGRRRRQWYRPVTSSGVPS